MIKGVIKQELTSKLILNKVSEISIFQFYMPNTNWKIGVKTLSPFRSEKTPSFVINYYSTNKITFIDFGDTSKKGNCFDFVKILKNIDNFYDVLKLIDKDFGLGISYEELDSKKYKNITKDFTKIDSSVEEKKQSFIQVITKSFTKEELSYWNDFHQSLSDLKENNIFSIKQLYYNREIFSIKKTDLIFGYYYDGFWKIYRPYANKKEKWMPNNVPITTLEGLSNLLPEKDSFINKSKKDYMVIKKLYSYTCAVQNEGMGCFSESNINLLKNNSKNQILSFDSDETGVKNSTEITKKFDFKYCNVPNKFLIQDINDWADLAKNYGMKKVEQILKQKRIL